MKQTDYGTAKAATFDPPSSAFPIGGDGQVAQELRNLSESVEILSKSFAGLKVHLMPVMTSPIGGNEGAIAKEEMIVPLADVIRSIRYAVQGITGDIRQTTDRMEM